MITVRFVLILLIVCCFGGCTTTMFQKTTVTYFPDLKSGEQKNRYSLVKRKLLSQYNEWKGTRYREGGLSKRGVDCSGFVQITFRSRLGVDLPRSTKQQVTIGRPVARNNLRTGDLIFFKTGFFSRHVGMYLGESRFLHASSAKGVTISSLKENYWAGNYWLARRIKM